MSCLHFSRKRCFSMVKSLQKSRIIQLSAGIVLELFRIKEYNINIAQVYSICKLKMNILYKSHQKVQEENTMKNNNSQWLENAVFYEIYPQSYKDTNADGIGNLAGMTESLPYIKSIGCNAIWINPCFE